MAGTLTYNFDPEQTVYAIVDCDASSGNSSNNTGLLISNAQFPGVSPIQTYPATGNIIVREGVVKELQASISEDDTNGDARLSVRVLGGQVISPGTIASMTVTVTLGLVVGVTITNGGANYRNGTGFTFLLTTTAGGGDGLAEITYDVVNGQVTNASVSVNGTLYAPDGVDIAVTDVPFPTGVAVVSAGNGYFPDSAAALVTVDIVGGVLVDAHVLNGGAQYADGVGFTANVLTSFGGGDGLGELSYTVVDGEITDVTVTVGGSLYIDGFNQVVNVSDLIPNVNQVFLTETAGGGDGLASIAYTVVGSKITNPYIMANGSTYTDTSRALVAEFPVANKLDYQLVYRIRFNDDNQTLNLEAPVDSAGNELDSDIFATLNDAIAEYQLRLS